MRPALVPALALTAILASPGSARAEHDVQAYISSSGVDFIGWQLTKLIPPHIAPPEINVSAGCMHFRERDWFIEVDFDSVDLFAPYPGRLRLEFTFHGIADGYLDVDNPYVCTGSATCRTQLNLRKADVVLEYEIAVVDGEARIVNSESDLSIKSNDIDIQLSGCGIAGDVATTAIGVVKGALIDVLDDKAEEWVSGWLGGHMVNLLDGFSYEASIGDTKVAASLDDAEVDIHGISLGITADVWNRYPAAACIADEDPGPRPDVAGAVPDLVFGTYSDLSVAVNFGFLDDALYHVWREGHMCVDDDRIENLGVDLDLSMVTSALPGFPPGTELEIEMHLAAPPRVRGELSNDAVVGLTIEGITANIIGHRPDGSTNTLHAEVDVEAIAKLGINPLNNAISARVVDAQVLRLVLEDERTATGQGFDVARLIQIIHERALPMMLEELGELDVTGPVFKFGDYALILRELATDPAYLRAGVDFFEVPKDDSGAPETILASYPTHTVAAKDSIVSVSGRDDQLPGELLRYRVLVDGEEQVLSFMREFKVGEPGVTRTYDVQVSAIDLSDNEDPTPVSASISVDGVSPRVSLVGLRARKVDSEIQQVSWSMSDDLTNLSELAPRVEIYHLTDPTDAMSTELIDTIELPRGATSAELYVPGGKIYRVEIHVQDAAGNDASSSLLLEVSGGGCSAGGAGSDQALWLLGLALLGIRRRRR